MIISYFEKLFIRVEREGTDIVEQAPEPKETLGENKRIIAIPNADENKESIFSVHADKAPRPDEFSASFFHFNWETIEAD